MARLTEQTIVSLFSDIQNELDEAIDFRREVGKRIDFALAHNEPTDHHQREYESVGLEIDSLRGQLKSVIDLAHQNRMDPGALLRKASQQQQNPEDTHAEIKTNLDPLFSLE